MGIRCGNDVVSTSMRRNYVASTLIRRHIYVMCPLGTFFELGKDKAAKREVWVPCYSEPLTPTAPTATEI